MSETPQERIQRWLAVEPSPDAVMWTPGVVREAIRAVLDRLAELEKAIRFDLCPKCGAGVISDCYGCRLKAAEAERDALKLKRREQFNRWGVQIRYEDQEQSLLERDALRVEVVRLRMAVGLADPGLLLLAATTRAKAAEAERDALMDDVQSTGKLWHEAESRAEKAEAALREWREAESSPDCIACCALDAALATPLSTEAEALAAMGDGQALTKVRIIGP